MTVKEKEVKKFRLPLNLQFFAEGKDEDKGEDAEKDNQDKGDTSKGAEKKEEKKTSLEDLLNDDDFAKDFQSTLDKRVTDALKKQEKKLKEQYENEKKQAQMTDEQKEAERQKQLEEERKQRETQLKARELKLDLIDVLEQEGMDAGFRDLVDVSTLLHIEDKEEALKEMQSKVKKLKSTFDSLVEKKVEEVKKEYLKGGTPSNLGKDDNNTPPNEYEKAKKNKDVKGMLASKFAGR